MYSKIRNTLRQGTVLSQVYSLVQYNLLAKCLMVYIEFMYLVLSSVESNHVQTNKLVHAILVIEFNSLVEVY